MVLVLALPRDFAHRDLLVTMTFGVVILSILLQGLSMKLLLRKLKLAGTGPSLPPRRPEQPRPPCLQHFAKLWQKCRPRAHV